VNPVRGNSVGEQGAATIGFLSPELAFSVVTSAAAWFSRTAAAPFFVTCRKNTFY
jgi:hypothetical protein